MKCPNCNFENPEQFKFCGECGTRIVKIIPEPLSPVRNQDFTPDESLDFHSVGAERRHITVMFCDLVGSTHLSEKLDPEDFRQLLHVYQDTCVYAVNKYEGHLAQYLGDGVLIYFGYPGAHEDDTQRAIRCGLEIVSELESLNELQTRFPGINLEVRIGVHTGLVVVGEMSRDKKHGRLALGNTPNIAARLQALADPNSIIISAVTYRLVRNFFNCKPLGAYSLKGISDKMDIFRVVQENEISYSFKTQATTGMTPFVGRENEIQNLLATWENVKDQNGGVVLIVGEPGIGKTRLLRFFEESIKEESHTWLVCRCISYYKNSAFYPIINLINSQLRLGKNEANEDKLKKLEEALSLYNFDLYETVPIIASLISIPISKPYKALHLTPQKQKEKTIQVLLEWLIRTANRNPLLFVIEDVHWADSSTLEHLTLLMEKIDRAPILIILTFHPRFNPPVNENSRLTEIHLHRLDREQIKHMVQDVTGGKILPAEVIDLLLTKTDGVPLFVEELTKMLLESGYLIEENKQYKLKRSLPKTAIPDTLQDTLMARLDRLGAEKEVVQFAAIIGREFSYDLIRAVISLDEDTLKKELNSLVEADILDLQDDPQHIRYIFRQVLIQEAAYNSLLLSTRQEHHRKIAQILEQQLQDFANTHPQIVAHHYTEACYFDRAIEYHLKSGKLLVQQSAHREAISQLHKGLELLKHIDDEKKRNKLELDFQITLGVPLLATKGYGAEEVGKVYERARDLSQKVGDIPQLFPALVGQFRFYLLRGDITKAFDISELLLSWAKTSGDSHLLLEANRSIGVTLFHMGEVATSLEHLEKAIDHYNPAQHGSHAHLYGSDPAVTCLSYGALAQCLLGYENKAVKYGKKAIQQAKKLKHPFSQVFALNHHAWLHQFYRETELVDKFATELLAVSQEYGFPFWQITGLFFQGWVLAQRKRVELGINQMEQSIKAFQATGAGSVLPYFMTAVAEVYLENDRPENALKWLEDAEVRAQKNREHFFDAEIYRVRGETIFALDRQNKKDIESLLWRAIETARRQGLKSLELRALMSLVRIGRRKKETMTLFRDTYKWFVEGLDTKDLKQAKNLLQEGSPPSNL
jgi:predicted ATPase/class 3 adenylate cyclase